MENTYSRKTLEKIKKQNPLFMEKLVKKMESTPTFKTYIECMVDYNGQDRVIATSDTKEATTA